MFEYQHYTENMMSNSKRKLLENITGAISLPGVKSNHINTYEIEPSIDVR